MEFHETIKKQVQLTINNRMKLETKTHQENT